MKKRYEEIPLPKGCSVRGVVVRELDGEDELEAAMWAEKKATPAQAESTAALVGIEQNEAIRLSIVAIKREREGSWERVNTHGIPFAEFDTWTMKTKRFVHDAFNRLNGATADEVKNVRAGAKEISEEDLASFAPAPRSAAPDGASSESGNTSRGT